MKEKLRLINLIRESISGLENAMKNGNMTNAIEYATLAEILSSTLNNLQGINYMPTESPLKVRL